MTELELQARKKGYVTNQIYQLSLKGITASTEMVQAMYDAIPASGLPEWTKLDEAKAKYEEVKPYEPKGPEMVDFGLPSGTLWAKCNIGAAEETDAGKYFAWGDAEGFEASEVSGNMFGNSWYNDRPGASLTGNIEDNDATHNAAFKTYGVGYTMPSQADFKELINISYADKQWTTINGVNGYKISKKNDSSTYIFLPAVGNGNYGSIGGVGVNGCIWSSSFSGIYECQSLLFSDGDYNRVRNSSRYYGLSVRAIKKQS